MCHCLVFLLCYVKLQPTLRSTHYFSGSTLWESPKKQNIWYSSIYLKEEWLNIRKIGVIYEVDVCLVWRRGNVVMSVKSVGDAKQPLTKGLSNLLTPDLSLWE